MQISEIEIGDRNEAHLTNRKNRAATHVARGTTIGGRLVLIPFIDQGAGRIRPITAWEVGI